ncbi:histone H1 [Litoribacter populi]|uniref:histone H1 n=1 Tax=Litoribacter populi TaxID=2598460 RepID=UPI00117D5A20|nr:histone H1 [Litoribacter populi]
MSRFEEVKNLISGLEDDFQKFYEKGNKAAGTRVRNGMNEAKKLAQEIRKEVTELKNSGK